MAVLSRLVPHKQIEDALDAIAELRPRIPDLHLDILGGGWWEQRLVDHAALLGISDAVTFHGHVDDDTKHRVLQQCWVHVLPSRKEGWGLAVTEAGQHCVPTIGYRCSGGLTDSIVDGVTGLLVDDRDGLVDGLERLLSDQVLREQLGAKAQARSGEFSWRQSADAMRTVLESMHAGPDRQRRRLARGCNTTAENRSKTRQSVTPAAPMSSASHTQCAASTIPRPDAGGWSPPIRYTARSLSR